MKREFQIGDKVRCVNAKNSFGLIEGKIYTIKEIVKDMYTIPARCDGLMVEDPPIPSNPYYSSRFVLEEPVNNRTPIKLHFSTTTYFTYLPKRSNQYFAQATWESGNGTIGKGCYGSSKEEAIAKLISVLFDYQAEHPETVFSLKA